MVKCYQAGRYQQADICQYIGIIGIGIYNKENN